MSKEETKEGEGKKKRVANRIDAIAELFQSALVLRPERSEEHTGILPNHLHTAMSNIQRGLAHHPTKKRDNGKRNGSEKKRENRKIKIKIKKNRNQQ
jgi:hypothetical protein